MISLRNILYEDKEMQDIMIDICLIKRNLIISRLSSVQKSI